MAETAQGTGLTPRASRWVLPSYLGSARATLDEWDLAVRFVEAMERKYGATPKSVFIVPRDHVTGGEEEGIAVCYEGFTDQAEALQFSAEMAPHIAGGVYFEMINHWSTGIVRG